MRFALPLIFMVLFLMSVLMTSGYLMQGTATEKENKVVDVLLASANPDEILAGKLLGLGAAGLLQIAVWLAMLMVTGLGVVPMLMSSRVDVPWLALSLALPFFIMAFLFFGGLMLGTGSLGSNMREAQQLAMVWSLTAALPMMMMAVLIREPNGTVAKVMTWMPFTAGPVVILRASNDAALLAWWEIAGSLLVLLRLDLAGAPRRRAPVPDRPAQRRCAAEPARDRPPGAPGGVSLFGRCSVRCHAAFAVHGACGALGASRQDETTTRRHDVRQTLVSHFDGRCPLAAPRFARWQE